MSVVLPDLHLERAGDHAREAVSEVVDGDADTLAEAVASIDDPALRADAEYLAENLLQIAVERRAADQRGAQ